MTTLDRRSLITAGAALAGAAAAAGCTNASEPGGDSATGSASGSPSQGPADLSDWGAVRAEFDLDPELAHFAAFVLAGQPRSVRDAIERWRGELDRDTELALESSQTNDDAVRRGAADYLGVEPNQVALTDSTTMGLAMVYQGLGLAAGDHVLTTTHDFYSTHESLRLATERSGATVEQVALYDDAATASVGTMVDRLRAALRPTTRAVALTWVHSSTGVKLPVRDLVEVVEQANAGRSPQERALVCLDAVHGFGAEDAGPADLAVDVFVSGTHKWLFGPRGTGLLWASPDAARRITPTIPSFSSPGFRRWLFDEETSGPFGVLATPGGYQAFEHRWAVAEAFAFHAEIGRARVAARTSELATRMKDGLAELPNVRLVTPQDPALSSGLVCCAVEGQDPFELVQALRADHAIAASTTPYAEPYVRFGTSIVTSPDEVDAAVDALAQ